MPRYTSIAELRIRYGNDITDFVGTPDIDNQELVTETVNRAIRDAESEVDTYLGTRNKLPLPGITERPDPENNTDVPDVLRRIASDIAVFRLSPSHDRLTKEKRNRYEDALKWLRAYAANEVSLGIERPVPSSIGVKLYTADRVLGRDDTDGLL